MIPEYFIEKKIFKIIVVESLIICICICIQIYNIFWRSIVIYTFVII